MKVGTLFVKHRYSVNHDVFSKVHAKDMAVGRRTQPHFDFVNPNGFGALLAWSLKRLLAN